MTLHQQLDDLVNRQNSILDGYRLYYDGSIRTATLTESFKTGWCVQAAAVPGAAPLIQSNFPEEKYLKVETLRDAISIRDRIFDWVHESRVTHRARTLKGSSSRPGAL